MTHSEINANSGNNRVLFNIKVEETGDEFKMLGRPCELSAFSFVPDSRDYESPERSIYSFKQEQAKKASSGNNSKENVTKYDQLHNFDYDFNNKTHRDDRKHAKLQGLNVWNEEVQKPTPSKLSSDIGKLILDLQSRDPIKVTYKNDLDAPDRRHVRIDKKAEFFNRNGINDLNRQRGVL
jgi:hypothetical protein